MNREAVHGHIAVQIPLLQFLCAGGRICPPSVPAAEPLFQRQEPPRTPARIRLSSAQGNPGDE